MAAHLDILEWRLERVRGEACAVLGESRRLAAEAHAILERCYGPDKSAETRDGAQGDKPRATQPDSGYAPVSI